MRANVKTFRHNLTAATAHLGGVGGVHGNEMRTSIFDFVRQHLPEHPQRRIVRGQGEVTVTGHKDKVQILNSDKAVLLGQLSGQFMPEITTLVGDMILQFGDLSLGLLPAGAKLFTARQTSLSNAQVTQRFSQPTRVINQCAIRQGQKAFQTNINTNSRAGVDCWFRVWQFKHQGHVPIAVAMLNDKVFYFCVIGNVAVQAYLDMSNVLNVESVTVQFTPVAIAILDGLKATAPLEAGQPALTFVKLFVGFIQSAKHLLNGCGVQQFHFFFVGVSFVSHPAPLVKVGNRLAAALPKSTAFIECVIVDDLHLKQKVIQDVTLLFGWSKSVLISAEHLLALLFVNIPLNCFSRDRSGSADKIAAGPHVRQPALEMRKFFTQHKGGVAFETVHNLVRGESWRERTKQVNVVNLNCKVQNPASKFYCFFSQKFIKTGRDTVGQYLTSVFWYPNEMIIDVVRGVFGSLDIHRTIVLHSLKGVKLTKGELASIPLPHQ